MIYQLYIPAVLSPGMDDQGSIPGGGMGFSPFATASTLDLWPTQPVLQWVLGALSLRVKRSGREANH
jgi:hypothetical protein